LKNNKHLVDFKVNEDGTKTYKLTKRAKTILNTHRIFENMKEDMKKQMKHFAWIACMATAMIGLQSCDNDDKDLAQAPTDIQKAFDEE
jgi:hypothetical protein